MTLDGILLIGILVFTVASFVFEWLPIDVTALTTLGLLLLFGLVTPEQAVAGFSNPAVVTVMMMFILSEALVQSGLVTRVGHRIGRLSGTSHWRASATLLSITGALSAFINNTAAVSISMPVAADLAKHYRISPSKILLPLSYTAIIGGMCTLIGTSTNLLVSALAAQHHLPAFRMFELAWLGLPLFVVGLAYNLGVVMRILPSHTIVSSLTRKYRMSPFLTEVKVPAGSPLLGRTALSEQVNERFNLTVLEILRGRKKIATDIRYTPLEIADILIVRGSMEDILAFKEQYGLLLLSDIKLHDADLADENNILAEVQLSPTARLAGQTLKEIDFRKRYGCFVLALNRTGEIINDKLALIPLQSWDTLLIFGPRQRIEGLAGLDDFIPLQEINVRLGLSRRWWVGALTIPLVVILAATGLMSVMKSAILGVVVLLVTRTVRIQQAYKAIDWTVIFLLAGILPLGFALEETGVAAAIGHGVVSLVGPAGPFWVLSALILVTSILTGFISNNSAAVLMVPIVVSVARDLGVDAKPLLMGVTFAASMSFFTPMGYQTNTMVYGPGGYRFLDYVKVGGTLNVLFWLFASFLIPVIWPF